MINTVLYNVVDHNCIQHQGSIYVMHKKGNFFDTLNCIAITGGILNYTDNMQQGVKRADKENYG